MGAAGHRAAKAAGDRFQATQRLGITRVVSWNDTRASLLGPNTFLGGFVSGLGGFVLLAALAVTAGLVSAQISACAQELAILSVLGASPGALLSALLAELATVATAATIIAVPVAALMVPWTQGLAAGIVDLRGGFAATVRPSHVLVAGGLVLIGTLIAGGYRSAIASSLLSAHGFRDVSDLVGGYQAWAGRS